MKRRTRIEIILDILENSMDGATKTRIVYGSNLNFNLASSYLDFLLKKNMISIESGDKKIYRTTEKGTDFLKRGKEFLVEIEPRAYQEHIMVIK